MEHESFAPLAIKLMQGVLYDEDTRLWTDLTKVQEEPLRKYFQQIGIQLIVNRTEGFAYLRQPGVTDTDDDQLALPRLMRRRPLTVDQSILCVLLRERMEEHTMLDTASREPVMHLKEITHLVDVFFKERNTQQRFLRDVKKTVEDLRGMGFLELVTERSSGSDTKAESERYRIKRILKAFIDTDELRQLHETLTTA
jgi:Domain of unknown function (DUF4194)